MGKIHVFLSFLFVGTGDGSQGFTLADQAFYHFVTLPAHFTLVILEVEFCKLFSCTGLEQIHSGAQPPKQLRS
jgi:hypothetical protein